MDDFTNSCFILHVCWINICSNETLNGEVYGVIEGGGGYTERKVYAITAGHDSTLYRPNCVFYFFFRLSN